MSTYLLSLRGAPDVEQRRLRLLQEYFDPWTARQLDVIGVGEGWRCLDAGAGGGSVTRMLADRVGPAGAVLALDLDTTLLNGLASGCVQVRRHDLLADPLPQAAFDLVHARMLLIHLPSRVTAIRCLAAAVRPGGWLAAADPDFTTVGLSPSTPEWERTWAHFCDAAIAGGWDPGYGARLSDELRAAGLIDVHADYVAQRGPGGSVVARLLSLTLERLRDRMVDLGADAEEIDESRRLLEDPARLVWSPRSCVAHGRRPVDQELAGTLAGG